MITANRGASTLAILIVSFLAVLCVTFAFPRPAECQTGSIENVFVVVIDGLRYSEAFGDPTYQNIPHLGNDLKAAGAFYTDILNLGYTVTAPSHQYIITGEREYTPQYENLDVRTLSPSIFEYYRKAFQLPEEKVWVIVGQKIVFLRPLTHSVNPAFGEPYQASLLHAGENDLEVYQKTIEVIDTHRPSLVLINFGDVDHMGHYSWSEYLTAIQTVDGLIYELWNYLQSLPEYQGKTALLVTTDHGRHDDAHGGFKNHGGICDGCKRCFLLALGPGIQEGVEINQTSNLVDIAPTVGHMLGFSTPFSQGRVLSEMFVENMTAQGVTDLPQITSSGLPLRLTYSDGPSISPKIAVSDGTIHLVWKEYRDSTWQIYYVKSGDGGNTWSPEWNLSSSTGFAMEPSITVGPERVLVAWKDYRNGNWEVYCKESQDAGENWSPEKLVASFQVETSDRAFVPAAPKLLADQSNTLATMFYLPGLLLSRKSGDQGDTWGNYTIVCNNMPVQGHSLINRRSLVYSIWASNNSSTGDWEIWATYSSNWGTEWRNPPRRLVASDNYLLSPTVASDDKYVYLAWSDFSMLQPQLHFTKGTERSVSSPRSITESTVGAVYPSIIKFGNDLCVAWEDNRDENKEIYYKTISGDGDPLSEDTRLTQDSSNSTHPDVTSESGKIYIVWQDDRDGNWEIYFQTLDSL